MQWFYALDGKRNGPVEEEELRRLISQGIVKPDTLIWNESMGDQWKPAFSVPALYRPATIAPAVPGSGTGGQTPNRDLMAQAREALTGKWGLAVGFSVLAFLFILICSVIPLIHGFVQLLVSGPLSLGFCIFFLALARKRPADISQLFDGFKQFGTSLGAYLLVALLVLGWMLLFFLPGAIVMGVAIWATKAGQVSFNHLSIPPALIILAVVVFVPAYIGLIAITLRYSQTFFLIADNPALGPLTAIRESKRIMIGKKWKLFCLYLRFIGWALLALLTCGIGYLWVWPYMMTSSARFYDDLKA